MIKKNTTDDNNIYNGKDDTWNADNKIDLYDDGEEKTQIVEETASSKISKQPKHILLKSMVKI